MYTQHSFIYVHIVVIRGWLGCIGHSYCLQMTLDGVHIINNNGETTEVCVD